VSLESAEAGLLTGEVDAGRRTVERLELRPSNSRSTVLEMSECREEAERGRMRCDGERGADGIPSPPCDLYTGTPRFRSCNLLSLSMSARYLPKSQMIPAAVKHALVAAGVNTLGSARKAAF